MEKGLGEAVIHEAVRHEEPILEIDGFNFWYGAKKALMDVSMNIAERKVTALIGPSGCGKSTLLRSINRLNDLIPGVGGGPAKSR